MFLTTFFFKSLGIDFLISLSNHSPESIFYSVMNLSLLSDLTFKQINSSLNFFKNDIVLDKSIFLVSFFPTSWFILSIRILLANSTTGFYSLISSNNYSKGYILDFFYDLILFFGNLQNSTITWP